jgi:hypothetical protein
MNERERQALAEHLAKLSYAKARREIRKLDPAANLKYWRNSFGTDIWHTAYELPSLGIKVTLVERAQRETQPDIKWFPAEKYKPVYVEARVEPLNR